MGVNGIQWFRPPPDRCATHRVESYPRLSLRLGCDGLASCNRRNPRRSRAPPRRIPGGFPETPRPATTYRSGSCRSGAARDARGATRHLDAVRKGECQPACKPGSVRRGTNAARDDHSSGTPVAGRLTQPTRAAGLETGRNPFGFHAAPIRFCSRWGLPCRFRCRSRGGLLPHPFTLTAAAAAAVCFLWHFPWGRPRRVLPGTVFPWSPDFPPPRRFRACGSGRPAG